MGFAAPNVNSTTASDRGAAWEHLWGPWVRRRGGAKGFTSMMTEMALADATKLVRTTMEAMRFTPRSSPLSVNYLDSPRRAYFTREFTEQEWRAECARIENERYMHEELRRSGIYVSVYPLRSVVGCVSITIL